MKDLVNSSERPALHSYLAVVVALTVLSGCANGLTKELKQSLSQVTPHKVDFREMEYYAVRSKSAYSDEGEIRSKFPDTSRVTTLKSVDVRYFIETDPKRKIQTISIRGTANKINLRQDLERLMVEDKFLGIKVHRGFRDDSNKVYKDMKDYVEKDYTIRVTGHSLGGAIALIVASYLNRDGYKVVRLVTFGQPKVTDGKGKHADGRMTRVAHGRDVVPMLPPTSVIENYRHIGPEVVLRDGADFVYLDSHDADRLSVGEFWRNLTDFSTKDHHMDLYLANIRGKVKNGSRQVPYEKPKQTRVAGGASGAPKQ